MSLFISLLMGLLIAPALYAQSIPFDGYIVKFKPHAMKSFFMKKGAASFGRYKQLKVSSLGNNFAKFYPVGNRITKNLYRSMMNNPEIEYIEPNYIYKVEPMDWGNPGDGDNTRDDLKWKDQWGFKNTGKNAGTGGVKGEDINVIPAWEITRGSDDIKIAVIDTGVDYNHSDLRSNIWINYAELNGQPGVDDDGNGYIDDIHGYDFANNDGDPMDDQGHGTHCAGVIGAKHNKIGVAGMMNNVKIVALKFLTATGSGTLEGAIQAIDYAIKAKVNIMSNSWGGGGFSQTLEDIIRVARDNGILFVAAAGNEYNNNDSKPTYPATYQLDNIVSVGAYTGAGQKASFSNYGAKTVHVFAPGKDIISTIPDNKYKKMSGTSMACPHVSGVLGLLLAAEPGIDYLTAKERLINTSAPTEALKNVSISKGRVDAGALLR